MMYSTVHAGPNAQSGGVQAGLLSDLYQAPGMNSAPLVATAPTAPRNGKKVVQFSMDFSETDEQ
jgi:hypothetical protein